MRVQNPNIIKTSEIDLFFNLSKEKSLIIFKKDEIIFRENTKPSGVYYLQSGSIKLYKTDTDKEQTIVIASKGDYFGLGSIMRNKNHTCTAIALENSKIYFMPGNEFLMLTAKFPEVAHQLLVKLCNLLDKKDHIVISKKKKNKLI